MKSEILLRNANRSDVTDIFRLIKGLSIHEKAPDAVIASEKLLEKWIFEKKWAEVIVIEDQKNVIGMSLFYPIFSAYLGRGGLFIDTLYVEPEYRGQGLGKMLLKRTAEIAVERGCMRLEWNCLDWNISSVEFYKYMGATAVDNCSIYRVTGDALNTMLDK